MRKGLARVLTVAAVGVGLAGCGVTTGSLNDTLGLGATSATPPSEAAAPASAPESTGTVPLGASAGPGLLGSEPYDDLNLGKRYLRAGNAGLAERHLRRAVETHPRDGEAWLDLGAAYDRLRRFDLADRAYSEAIRLVGPRVAILNNQGYSYMLRGDFRRARDKLEEARRKDPGNRFVENNLRLLAEASAHGKAVE